MFAGFVHPVPENPFALKLPNTSRPTPRYAFVIPFTEPAGE